MLGKKSIILWLYLFVLIFGYWSYVKLVLRPEQISHFSLIDDGQQIDNSIKLSKCFLYGSCVDAKNVFAETQFGRFRPVYWIIQWFNTSMFGLRADLHHQARAYVYGTLLIIGWFFISSKLKINKFFGLVLAFCFVNTSTFTENILRLGPTEPYLLLVLVIAAMQYLTNTKYWWIAISLLTATLVKETGLISFLPYILISNKQNKSSKVFIILVFAGLIAFLAMYKNLESVKNSSLVYSTNYNIGFSTLSRNTVSFLSVIYSQNKLLSVLGFAAILFFVTRIKNFYNNKPLLCLAMLAGLNFIILIPWSYVLERYVMVSLYFLYLLFGVAFTYFWNFLKIRHLIVYGVSYVLFVNVISTDLLTALAKNINYHKWLNTYIDYEYDYTSNVAKNLAARNKIVLYINADNTLDNWEVMYEIPLHMNYFYNLNIFLKNDISLMKKGDLLLINSSLSSKKPIDNEVLKLVSFNNFRLEKVDSDRFVKEVRNHPIGYFDSKVFHDDELLWWWKIYEKVN